MIRQLQVVGGLEVVQTLGKLLVDEDLCEYAAQALVAINNGAAEQFRRALPKSPPPCRPTIVQNLGVLRDKEAVDLLKQIKALSGDSDYLFPSPRNKGQPVVAVSLSHAVKNNLAAWKVAPFTPHDLRRSAASELAQLGISRLVIEKILNHKDKGIAGVYDRYGYDREKRHALDADAR